MNNQIELLTVAALARRLDISNITLVKALHAGTIVPPFRAGKYSLFRLDEVPAIREQLRKGGTI